MSCSALFLYLICSIVLAKDMEFDDLWGSIPHIQRHQTICAKKGANVIMKEFSSRSISGRSFVSKCTGGLGNKLNTLMHTFLLALISGRTLLTEDLPKSNDLRYFSFPDYVLNINSNKTGHHHSKFPYSSFADLLSCSSSNTNRRSICSENMVFVSEHGLNNNNVGLLNKTLQHKVMRYVHGVSKGSIDLTYEEFRGCAAMELFKPGPEVREMLLPYLITMLHPKISIGVHLRTSDAEMASTMKLGSHPKRRQLTLQLKQRPGCLSPKYFHSCLQNLQSQFSQMRPTPNVTYAVASDSQRALELFTTSPIGGNAPVIIGGAVVHSGRDADSSVDKHLVEVGHIKVVSDVFLQVATDIFISNCHMMPIGNTFVYNILSLRNDHHTIDSKTICSADPPQLPEKIAESLLRMPTYSRTRV